MKKGLVSIIIPTYNRSHLIGETLDSVIAQTYQNWECVVVDDGSTDYTKELLEFYCQKDHRIKFYKRPSEKPKGANACRNFGFELSTGEFINWFDSDDLMFRNALEKKINGFENHLDFVISNSLNFDVTSNYSRPFPPNYQIPINAENYIGNRINWITNDVLLRRSSICVRFDEKLQSGQEYNFFSRFLCYNNKGKYLHQDLTKRRIHENSIQSKLQQNESKKVSELLFNEKRLLGRVQDLVDEPVINRSLRRIIRFTYQLSHQFRIGKNEIQLLSLLLKSGKFKVLFFCSLWISTKFISGKGYFFLKKCFKLLK